MTSWIYAWDYGTNIPRRVRVTALGRFEIDVNALDLTEVGGVLLTGRDISGRGLGFVGTVYENQDIAAAAAARRFSIASLMLRDVIIQVTLNDQSFGDAGAQRYVVHPGDGIGFTQVDISTLWFANTVPAANGTVTILGTRD